MLMWLSLLAALVHGQSAPSEETTASPSVHAPTESVVVVELFTSQGCPMCPSANQLLSEFGAREDVIALGWGVNYWDAYGWRDQFAMPEFIARQQAYVDAGEARRVYTPHFVVNGDPARLRFKPDQITEAVNTAALIPRAQTHTDADGVMHVRLSGQARPSSSEIWVVFYKPGIEVRMIESGRNAGTEMTHFNMVRDVRKIGEWAGGQTDYPLPEAPDGLASVVLVQDGPGGMILSASQVY